MPNVDSLNIQISAEAQKADKELSNLISKLDKVQKSINKASSGGGIKFPITETKATEKSFSGVYAVIDPAIRTKGQEILKGWARLLKRLSI